jgi:hypothetical protein
MAEVEPSCIARWADLIDVMIAMGVSIRVRMVGSIKAGRHHRRTTVWVAWFVASSRSFSCPRSSHSNRRGDSNDGGKIITVAVGAEGTTGIMSAYQTQAY